MNSAEFIEVFRELIQTDSELTPATPLESVEEWDSMAIMALIAYLDVEHGTQATFARLKELKTVGVFGRLIPVFERCAASPPKTAFL